MAADQIVPDGTLDFSGGQNAALHPAGISSNQYFIGVNVSAQTGNLCPRWALTDVELIFTDTDRHRRATGFEVSYESIFKSGKFQAIIPYGIGPDRYKIYIVSGFIYLINLSTSEVSVINKTDQVNVYADRVNWSNAGDYLVIFDYPNRPFILEGIMIRRSDPTKDEVPVSVLGTYNQNRLCIANAGIDWTAGDPSGSRNAPDAPVTFIEILQPSTGFTADVYQIPTSNINNDYITAMGFLQVLDTSTGIGPLLVATNNAIYSYRTDQPRLQWQGGSNSAVFGSVLLKSAGIVGQRAHVNVGSDLIFLGSDGQVYDLTMSRNAQFKWSNSPISREVANFLDYIDPSLAAVAAVAYFKNKVFITCKPYRVDCYSSEGVLQTDYVSRGVVVIEADNMASMSNESPPAWAGVWTGVDFMDFAQSGDVFYTAAKINGENKLFQIDPEKTYDTVNGKTRYVRSVVYTKEYVNGDATINKEVHSLDLGLRLIEEKLKVAVEYKTSTSEIFNFWKELNYDAPVEQCDALPPFPNGLVAQGIRDLNLGSVDETQCDLASREVSHIYKGIQLRIVLTGKYWELDYVKLRGRILPDSLIEPYCDANKGVPIPAQCFDLWFIPEETNC